MALNPCVTLYSLSPSTTSKVHVFLALTRVLSIVGNPTTRAGRTSIKMLLGRRELRPVSGTGLHNKSGYALCLLCKAKKRLKTARYTRNCSKAQCSAVVIFCLVRCQGYNTCTLQEATH